MQEYSVLMPVYKKEVPQFLIQSLESIVNQTYPTNDFVIVEDGPLTKELYEILDEYEKKYSYIHRIVQIENKGCGASLNYGFEYCKNDLVARMDSDDISVPQRCEKQIKEFERHPEVDIIGTAMYEFSTNSNRPEYVKFMPVTSEEIYKYGKRRIPFNHPTVMYRKSIVFNQHGGYCTERYMDDSDLFSRLLYSGVKGWNIKEPLLKYRADAKQVERRFDFKSARIVIRCAWRNYKKHYAGFFDLLYVCVLNVGICFFPIKLRTYLFKKFTRKRLF